MYWYTNKKKIKMLTVLLTLGTGNILTSCNSKADNEMFVEKKTYFDIPAYFSQEISSYEKNNPLVLKTVFNDGQSEQKEIHLSDWNIELSPFLGVDLNLPVYQGLILKDSSNNEVQYTFTDDKLDLKKVKIIYDKTEAIQFEIEKITKNSLYRTTEKLLYQKGKMYTIHKTQKVILLDENDYKISGEIK